MRKEHVPLLFVLVIAGCHDPRDEFVGVWKGAMKTTVRFSDGSSRAYPHGEATLVINAPPRSNELTFNGDCSMTAVVHDDRAFTINKKACPLERITVPGASGTSTVECELVETVTGGAGSRSGDALTVTWSGDSQISRCSDGFRMLATYASEMLLSR